MKTLSVRQPWVHAILSGLKTVENRSWRTKYRGPLLIHAAKGRQDLGQEGDLMPGLPPYEELAFGAAVGIVDLVDIVPLEAVAGDPFASGPLCWILENPRPIEPIPMPGRLMLFETPDHLIRLRS